MPYIKSASKRRYVRQNDEWFVRWDRVFDQSIVGIFPKDNSKLYYLLALMNSDAMNDLIHIINPTANNSANYIKQLPYIEPAQEVLSEITFKVRELISLEESMEYDAADCMHKEINFIIGGIYENRI